MGCDLHGPRARYVKLQITYVPGVPETFSLSPRVNNPNIHHSTCVMRMPGSLTSLPAVPLKSGVGGDGQHSQRMPNLQFYVSGERPVGLHTKTYFPTLFGVGGGSGSKGLAVFICWPVYYSICLLCSNFQLYPCKHLIWLNATLEDAFIMSLLSMD